MNDEGSQQSCDSYEDKLRSLFNSCLDPAKDSDCLDEPGFRLLCSKLELDTGQTETLFASFRYVPVAFEDFKQGLVALLESSLEVQQTHEEVGAAMNPDQKDDKKASSLDIIEDSDQTDEVSNPRSQSMPSSLHYENPKIERTYLRSIWSRIGVGQDGFLDRTEMAKVCDCIGSTKLPDDVVDDLFRRLDRDQDGRVSFDELLTLFQGFGPEGSSDSHQPRCSSHPQSSPLTDSSLRPSVHDECSYFSELDTNRTGMSTLSSLVDYFERIGFENLGRDILKDLGFGNSGFDIATKEIDLKQLTSLLEDEVAQAINSPEVVQQLSVKAGVAACQHEVRFLQSTLNQATYERDKLRLDLSDANQRAVDLAQEIDEQNAKVERAAQQRIREIEHRYSEQIRDLQSEIAHEKDVQSSMAHELDLKQESLETKMAEKETAMRDEIEAIKADFTRLERENLDLIREIEDLTADNQSLQSELAKLTAAMDGGKTSSQQIDAQIRDMNEKIEELSRAKKDLEDQNDELNLQLEAAKEARSEGRSSAPGSEGSGRILRRTAMSFDHSAQKSFLDEAIENGEGDEAVGEEHPRKDLLRFHSLGAEIGFDFSGPSSVESVDDSIVLSNNSVVAKGSAANWNGNNEDGNDKEEGIQGNEDEDLDGRGKTICSNCQTLTEKLEELQAQKAAQLEQSNQELQRVNESKAKVDNEKDILHSRLRETTVENVSLSSELHRYELEMQAVRSRLLMSLNEVDLCREKQAEDQQRIARLSERCQQMQKRLSSLNIDCYDPSTSSSSSGTTTIRTSESKKDDNIQIIAVRSESVPSESSAISQSQRTRSSSPCISKVMVNSSEDSLSSPEVGNGARPKRNRKTSHPVMSSASFCVIRTNASSSLSSSSSSSASSHEPHSLPISTNAVKRSRSTMSSSSSQQNKVQVFQLEQHCKNLEGELDSVKDEIMRILSEKSNKSRENESLKHYVKAYEEMRRDNESLRKELALIKMVNPPKSPALSTSSKSSSASSSNASDTQNIDRSSPDGQEFYDIDTHSSSSSGPSSKVKGQEEAMVALKKQLDEMQQQLDSAMDEKKRLEQKLEEGKGQEKVNDGGNKNLNNKCKELEDSLELMQKEFENMEDYWQNKLDEERSFYESQVKDYEEKFKELEAKMKDYEELLMASEKSSTKDVSSTEDKLSTIAESASLEGQVADLEEEISELKMQLKSMQEQKYEACRSLEVEWAEKLRSQMQLSEEEKVDLVAQICDLEEQLKNTQEQLKKALHANERLHTDLLSRLTKQSASHNNNNNSSSNSLGRGLWRRASQSSRQTAPPQAFQSLPPDLHLEMIDLQKLDELRKVMQKECEQLLVQRQQLKKDLVRMNNHEQELDEPNKVGEGSLSLDASFRHLKIPLEPFSTSSDSPSNVADSSRRNNGGKTTHTSSYHHSALATLAKAYKTVFDDIAREKSSILTELLNFERSSKSQPPNGHPLNPLKILQARLHQQEERCFRLQEALKQQQRHSERILKAARFQHKCEIENLESLMKVNQDILNAQMEKCKEQMKRLMTSDNLVRHLATENETLLTALKTLEMSIHAETSNSSSRSSCCGCCCLSCEDESGSDHQANTAAKKCLQFIQGVLNHEGDQETKETQDDLE